MAICCLHLPHQSWICGGLHQSKPCHSAVEPGPGGFWASAASARNDTQQARTAEFGMPLLKASKKHTPIQRAQKPCLESDHQPSHGIHVFKRGQRQNEDNDIHSEHSWTKQTWCELICFLGEAPVLLGQLCRGSTPTPVNRKKQPSHVAWP